MTIEEVIIEMNGVILAYQKAGHSEFEKAKDGVTLQQKLTAILLKLSSSNRDIFYRCVRTRLWIAHFTGATAVALLAGELMRQGLKTYLPQPSEDLSHKIDLIAIDSKKNQGYCFQVKGEGNGQGKLSWRKASFEGGEKDVAMIIGSLRLVLSRGIGWKPLNITLELPQRAYLDIGSYSIFSNQIAKMLTTV